MVTTPRRVDREREQDARYYRDALKETLPGRNFIHAVDLNWWGSTHHGVLMIGFVRDEFPEHTTATGILGIYLLLIHDGVS